jgi:hypothetical protein
MSILIPVMTWPEVKAQIDLGRSAVLGDVGGMWEITITEPPYGTCDLPSVTYLKQMVADDPALSRYFPEEWCVDFETNYLPRFKPKPE